MIKCVVGTRDPEDWEKGLERPEFEMLDATIVTTTEEATALMQEAEIAIGIPAFFAEGINNATELRWVQSSFAGVDALCAPGLRTDYVLTNMKGVYGNPIAEYVFAYILSDKRRLTAHRSWQASSEWNQTESDVIEGSSIAIFGTGSIGGQIARIAKAFGMKTIGVSRSGQAANHFDSTFSIDQLEEALNEPVDYVVGVLPGTEATTNFFDTSVFSKLKGEPMFINVGRGASAVEADIVNALDAGLISKAVLDVFHTEPLPQDSPLWNHDQILLTPHNSGYVSLEPIVSVVADNFRRYLNSEPLLNQVNFELGY